MKVNVWIDEKKVGKSMSKTQFMKFITWYIRSISYNNSIGIDFQFNSVSHDLEVNIDD